MCYLRSQKRKEERELAQKRLEENKDKNSDTVEISEDGKVLLKDNADSGNASLNSGDSLKTAGDAIKAQPVIYTGAGEAGQSQEGNSPNISVSI